MRKLLLFLIVTLFVFNVKAQEKKPYEYHNHDGFYLSMSVGPNFSGIRNNVVNDAIYKYSGTGSIFDLKIGGSINENLILHGTILTSSLSGPKIESNGENIKTSNSLSMDEVMVGGGFTYYMLPSNIFVSVSAGVGGFALTDEEEDIDISTDKGFSFQLKLGKEWWISKNWAFGIGLSYGNSNVTNKPNEYLTEKLNSNNLSILFNTTFN